MLVAERGKIALERRVRPHVGDLFQGERTSLPSLRRSTKSVGRPVFGTVAKASTTGVCGMSLPRMLNSHETACGSDTTKVPRSWVEHLAAQAARSLLAASSPAIAQIVQHDGTKRRLGPVGPDDIDRIFLDRDETLRRRSAQGLGEPFGAVDRVQPGGKPSCAPPANWL